MDDGHFGYKPILKKKSFYNPKKNLRDYLNVTTWVQPLLPTN